ncbi:ParB/RepB/Spo0J family partition protein [Streptomyces novaecaesareae]|uniref:ParB/RepB/Spo0J family partition protein n=1 Tax=Streptomyces novaecaesareae TaxID=68244 RepID=UPI0004AB7580|nr:ParB/RepB/Spo0J family partition protein [Streptomyces novaecaesareae]
MKAADRLGTGVAFGGISRPPRSERGRAKAQAEGSIPDYEIQRIPLARVALCPMNPRRYYGTEEQREKLGQSLARKQTTACVAVTRDAYLALWPSHESLIGEQTEFVLMNGERRHRSASLVGLDVLDFVVRDDLATSQADFMDYLMAENEDREDFNIIERAMGLEQLLAACGGNAAEVARRRGRDRSWVGNQILLLTLPSAIQDRLASGEMAERYGRRLARAYKDDKALTADDLLALEEQLKEEERAKRIAQRNALQMLSADNIPTPAERSAAEAVPQTVVLSADNTVPETVARDTSIAAGPTAAAPATLSADNTGQPAVPQGRVPAESDPAVGSPASRPAGTPGPLPRQVPATDPAPALTADQLVRALGETAEEQAATLHAGLDTDGLLALVDALHALV